MKRVFYLMAIAVLCMTTASCSKSVTERMAMAKDVIVTCDPEVLVVKDGETTATITVTYPKGYFHPKAIVSATPVIVKNNGGVVEGPTFTYQGEKVKDNFKVISKDGDTVKETVTFKFEDGMEKCVLNLNGVLTYKGEEYEMRDIKLAEGCITTGVDAVANADYKFKEDGYQEYISQVTEGQIKYDVNSAKVKKNELSSSSIKEMLEELNGLKENERVTVKGTEIVAYASPEGGQKYNAELSDRRAESAQKAWEQLGTGVDGSDPKVKSIGQDWDGFQEAVERSDIKDKDLILRVLSMYGDPAVRESEIRNISQIFTELKKEVLPELRRARFITSSEFKNYTDEELVALAKNSLDELDEVSVLHLANIANSIESKISLNDLAVDKFNSQVGLYNLACCYLDLGKVDDAKACINRVKNQKDNDVINVQGVIKMLEGDLDGAALNFEKCHNIANLGTVDLIKGDYAEAANKLAGTNSINRAVAFIMNNQLDEAQAALKGDNSAEAEYYRAIISARQGYKSDVERHLLNAYEKDPSLKAKAENDLEFAKYI